MREFTDMDFAIGGKFPRIICNRSDLIDCPLQWQLQGLQQTATGYGRKLATTYKISFCGRLYRVYCAIFSNNGTTYIETKKFGTIVIDAN